MLFHCFVRTNACWLTESVFGSTPGAAGAAHWAPSLPCSMPLPPGHHCAFCPASAKSNMSGYSKCAVLLPVGRRRVGEGLWPLQTSELLPRTDVQIGPGAMAMLTLLLRQTTAHAQHKGIFHISVHKSASWWDKGNLSLSNPYLGAGSV